MLWLPPVRPTSYDFARMSEVRNILRTHGYLLLQLMLLNGSIVKPKHVYLVAMHNIFLTYSSVWILNKSEQNQIEKKHKFRSISLWRPFSRILHSPATAKNHLNYHTNLDSKTLLFTITHTHAPTEKKMCTRHYAPSTTSNKTHAIPRLMMEFLGVVVCMFLVKKLKNFHLQNRNGNRKKKKLEKLRE